MCKKCGGPGPFREKRTKCVECEREESRGRAEKNSILAKQRLASDPTRREALRAYKRQRYRDNLEGERARSRDWQRTNVEKVKKKRYGLAAKKLEYVNALKAVPCLDCDGSFPVECMDLDHVRGEKIDDVSAMITRAYSLESVVEECAKCEVVCANCHRIRTRKRKNGFG